MSTYTNDERVAAVERHLLNVDCVGHRWVTWLSAEDNGVIYFNALSWGEAVDQVIDYVKKLNEQNKS